MANFVSSMSGLRTLISALAAFAFLAVPAQAEPSLTKGAANYKPVVVEHIGKALAGAKELKAAVKANDVKAAQAAWIKSRKGWEAIEPITGEFGYLDEVIDFWPDAKHGYHAVEDAVFAGKLDGTGAAVDELVVNLAEFGKWVKAESFQLSPKGLLNGITKLAYEVGENKSKGGESPYAGTSLIDMHENVEGIEAVWKLVFEEPLQAKEREARRGDRREDRAGRGPGAGEVSQADRPAGLAEGGRGAGGALGERGIQARSASPEPGGLTDARALAAVGAAAWLVVVVAQATPVTSREGVLPYGTELNEGLLD
ncbi:MAG: EfeM/EfeO family lipoprotein [Pseudolabrys sp.]|jgi:iron uptake system component EfeO